MAQADMIFNVSGKVYKFGTPNTLLPNHSIALVFGYHQYINGVSTPGEQTINYSSDANGNYAYVFPGPNNPLINYDLDWGLNVTVGNLQGGWTTKTAGQYSGDPQPPSPANIPVSDTILQSMH